MPKLIAVIPVRTPFLIRLVTVLFIVGGAVATTYTQQGLSWVRGGTSVPSNAVVAGSENKVTLYICRVNYAGSVVFGKVVHGRCYFSTSGSERDATSFDILVGHGGYWTRNLNTSTAVLGGSSGGQPIYVCRVSGPNGTIPGSLRSSKCHYSFERNTYSDSNYEVLNGTGEAVVSLLDAAQRGDAYDVRAALRGGQAINQKNSKGQTALMLAASKGSVEVVNVLINEGATIDARDDAGLTALSHAAFGGNAISVRQLLRAGASLSTRSDNGNTPLYYAAASGDIETVRTMMTDGAYSMSQPGFPLHGAAAYDRIAMIDYLVNQGRFDVDELDNNGETAMMAAARANRAAAISALLRAGANVSIRTPNNFEVFGLAAVNNAIQAMDVLLDSGKFSVSSPVAGSALRMTARDSRMPALKHLLNRGVDPNMAESEGRNTALMLAAFNGHDEVVKELLRSRADVNAKNSLGETALILAASRGRRSIVKELIKSGADVDVADNRGLTALQHAIQNKHDDTKKEIEKAKKK